MGRGEYSGEGRVEWGGESTAGRGELVEWGGMSRDFACAIYIQCDMCVRKISFIRGKGEFEYLCKC